MPKLSKPIQVVLFIALVFVIILLYSKVSHLFAPMYSVFQLIFVPILLAMFFYYLIRPVVTLMRKAKINRMLSIVIIFLVLSALLVWFILAMVPKLQQQLISLINNAPGFFNTIIGMFNELQQHELYKQLFPESNFQLNNLTDYINQGLASINDYVGSLVSFLSNFTIVLVTTPIILFFLLLESEKFPVRITNATPKRFQHDMKEILTEFDQVLNNFIVGRVLINVALGVLMYIGFLIIDLPYALLLTTIAVIANFIPFIGAFLSSVPIVIIALVDSPMKAVWALVIILLAQQIQDNLIAPYIFGKQLNIHPLTTIILVLGAGKIGGIIAMIIIIPVYLIIKITAVKVYQLFIKDKWEKL